MPVWFMAANQAYRARVLVHSCGCHPWLRQSKPSLHSEAFVRRRRVQAIVAVSVLTLPSCQPPNNLKRNSSRRSLPPSPVFASLGHIGPVAGFATDMAERSRDGKQLADPIVTVEWLRHHLGDSNIKVLDTSWYMPNDNRNPLEEYKVSHIPGALFFDVDGVVDSTSDLPHMLPSEVAFAAAASFLGISNNDTVVVYDGKGIFSAARVWWMFRTFGHENVLVLDGGLPQWRAAGFEVESDVPENVLHRVKGASEIVQKIYQGQKVGAPTFKAKLQPDRVWSLQQVKNNLEEQKCEIVDARSKARFDGVAPEPRKGIRGGHIPGSKCVPFTEVLKDGAKLLEPKELETKFKEAGVTLNSPIVTSCGTGVTACVLALALNRLGKDDVSVYDGSWTEWGGVPDTPVATNVAS